MPILAWLTAIGAIILPLVKKVLVGLGIGYITYQGMDYGLTWASGLIEDHMLEFVQAWPQYAGLVGVLNLDRAVTMIVSAGMARIAMQAASRWIVGSGGAT